MRGSGKVGIIVPCLFPAFLNKIVEEEKRTYF